jgi:hypothetical protein
MIMSKFIIGPTGCYTKLDPEQERELAEMAFSIRTRPARARRVRAPKRVSRVRVRRLSPQREECLATLAGMPELWADQPSL